MVDRVRVPIPLIILIKGKVSRTTAPTKVHSGIKCKTTMTHHNPSQVINSVSDAHPKKPWNAFGHRFYDLWIDGRRAEYEVMNERAVRAAAGLMMLTAAIAFALAIFEKLYLPMQQNW